MDEFTPSQITTPPYEQSRLANGRNPNSLQHLWQRQQPLHSLSQRSRSSQSQGRSRLARLDKLRPVQSRDMFPLRVFNPPSIFQGNPAWADVDGAANWRTFGVWTGNALNYVAPTFGFSPSVLYPEMVQVAHTCGYNFDAPVANESYNEAFSNMMLGLYGDGNDILFTAPVNSFASFWVTWDQNITVNGQLFFLWPVLHFGGIDNNGDYFGDATSENFNIDFYGAYGGVVGMPDLIALGNNAKVIACLIISSEGGSGDTGNDGTSWILQCAHDHLQGGIPASYRGEYNAFDIYYPGDSVHEQDQRGVDNIWINSTQYALVGYGPVDFAVATYPPGEYPTPNYGAGATDPFSVNPWSTVSTPYYEAPDSSPVSFSAQPFDESVAASASVSYTATPILASADFQWEINTGNGSWAAMSDGGVFSGTSATGVTTSTLSISSASGLNGCMFRVGVTETSTGNFFYSRTAYLATDPAITSQPSNTTVAAPRNVSFSVSATGTSLTYQWQLATTNLTNNAIYSGVTTPKLVISNSTGLSGGSYRCVVSGGFGTLNSTAATLTVT